MEVIDYQKTLIEFDKLKLGDVFQQGVYIYIKISNDYCDSDECDCNNALWFGDEGIETYHFDSDDLVTSREAKLILQ